MLGLFWDTVAVIISGEESEAPHFMIHEGECWMALAQILSTRLRFLL